MKRALRLADLEPYREAGLAVAAKKLRRHSKTVAQYANLLGFEFKFTTKNRVFRETREAIEPVVIILAEFQFSQKRIAEILGVGRIVVRRVAEECGVKFSARRQGEIHG